MHRFVCYNSSGQHLTPNLQGAHLIGNDNVPVRGEVSFEDDEIRCKARTQDPVGLSLLWTVNGFGTLQLQTTRLPARERVYNLHVELARHLLMRISVKREEWGLFDYSGMEDISETITEARDCFIAALQASDEPVKAAQLADKTLALGLEAADRMTSFHAEVFLNRRQQTGGFSGPFLGVSCPTNLEDAAVTRQLTPTFDFVRIPMVWRDVQPTEHGVQYEPVERTIKLCAASKLALRGGPLLNFGVRSVPDWMYIWENDFESIHDAAREFVERTVKRFAKSVSSWTVISGVHADNVFGFSFEQIMELTRMAASVTKQHAPRSQVLIDLTQPWGEYYARNQQTIPPLFFADMAVQSGISFDGFGLQLLWGLDSEGYHLRDVLQVSALIDKLANLGKPLHITALGAPSAGPAATDGPTPGGEWKTPWSEELQADWLTMLSEICLSKPYVETVCIQPLIDSDDNIIAQGGLLREDLTPKPALAALANVRKRLASGLAQ